MIYFVQNPRGGPIKIGRTKRFASRVYGLRKESGCPDIKLLAIVDEGPFRETQLHRRFVEHWVEGEWFHPHHDILRFITENGRAWTPADDTPVTNGDSKMLRISTEAYGLLSELAGMRHMKLGDCASDLILRYADRESKEHAKLILKRGEPKG
jgi:hypothetical protein